MTLRPLSGVRIVDMTMVVAGPVGTSLLASLGAEVIKIENTIQRVVQSQSQSRSLTGFTDLNRGKQSVTLNLNVPQARAALLRLVAVSDVVIDNFSPRVTRNFHLEYADLVKVKPDIIVVSMPAYGKTGPLRDRISFGPGIDAMSGLSHLSGYPDAPPLKPGNYYCDYNAGVLAAMSVMAAVFARRRTGKGQFVEVAMRDGLTQLIGESVLDYILNGRVQERAANRHPSIAPHSVYACRGDDRWVAITATNDAEWAALCGAMSRPGLTQDERFATATARKRNEGALDAAIAEWTREQDHIETMHRLQAAGVPASAVMSTDEIARDPQFLHRGTFVEVALKDGGAVRLVREAWRSRDANPQPGRAPGHSDANPRPGRAPGYSEHTEHVLRDLIGLGDAEIAELAALGGIRLPEAT